jgi:hypothetical protein
VGLNRRDTSSRRVNDGIACRIARQPEGPSRRRKVRIDKKELEAGIGQMFLDAAAHAGARRRGPGLPRSSGAIGALRKPAAGWGVAKEAAVL